MYWTLEIRRPTLDEIIAQGEARIRKSIEDVCARFEAPQIEPEIPASMALAAPLRLPVSLRELALRQQASMAALRDLSGLQQDLLNNGIGMAARGEFNSGFLQGYGLVEAMRNLQKAI